MAKPKKALAYLRTSSAANVGDNKDSDKRQRQAITSYARRRRIQVIFGPYRAIINGSFQFLILRRAGPLLAKKVDAQVSRDAVTPLDVSARRARIDLRPRPERLRQGILR